MEAGRRETTPMKLSPRRAGTVVWVVLVGIITGAILASDDPRDRSAENWVFVAGVALVTALIWWLLVVRPIARPEGNTPAKAGLIAGIVAVPAIVVFWAGLPFVLGAAALVLGLEGRARAESGGGRAGIALAATILGAVVSVGWLVIMVSAVAGEI